MGVIQCGGQGNDPGLSNSELMRLVKNSNPKLTFSDTLVYDVRKKLASEKEFKVDPLTGIPSLPPAEWVPVESHHNGSFHKPTVIDNTKHPTTLGDKIKSLLQAVQEVGGIKEAIYILDSVKESK